MEHKPPERGGRRAHPLVKINYNVTKVHCKVIFQNRALNAGSTLKDR